MSPHNVHVCIQIFTARFYLGSVCSSGKNLRMLGRECDIGSISLLFFDVRLRKTQLTI